MSLEAVSIGAEGDSFFVNVERKERYGGEKGESVPGAAVCARPGALWVMSAPGF